MRKKILGTDLEVSAVGYRDDTTTTELFEYKHKTGAINIEEMHIMQNIQIEETYIK